MSDQEVKSNSETFTPTLELRWACNAQRGVLQQCWQGSNGTHDWRNIPQVDVSPEYFQSLDLKHQSV